MSREHVRARLADLSDEAAAAFGGFLDLKRRQATERQLWNAYRAYSDACRVAHDRRLRDFDTRAAEQARADRKAEREGKAQS